jgi:signal transduction histidine kinase
MVVLGGTLLAVALVAAFALVVSTAFLVHETMRIRDADARMRASLRTKVALLWYARASDLAVSARSVRASDDEARAESELRAALAETRRMAMPERWLHVDNLANKADTYIGLRRRLEAEQQPLAEIELHATPALESVFRDLDQLIASDDAWIRSVEASARRWDTLATGLGIAAAVLLLTGFAGAMVATGLLVERPVLALTAAMFRFANGDETSRTVPRGARELRQVGSTFNEMADRLVRQNENRLAFLAGVAHDLRNPISTLKLSTDSLARGPQPPPPEKSARTLAIVARQVQRLDRMVGDLLDATRIEAGRFELRSERIDLRSTARNVAELYRAASEAHAIETIAGEAPVLAICDPARIEQVLTNLVSNAIKYSPGGGRVILSVAQQGDDAVVSVADEGLGIPPEDRERIFDPFHRAARTSERIPGIGLGLSVARKLVEAHGGRLEVESQVGVGSTFRMRLPREGNRGDVGADA